MLPTTSLSEMREMYDVTQMKTQNPPRTHHIDLKWQTLKQVENGQKTVAGLDYKDLHQKIRPGDQIIFRCWNKKVICLVQDVSLYNSLSDMLEKVGGKKCFHQIRTIDGGVNIFDDDLERIINSVGQRVLGIHFCRQFDSRYRLQFGKI